MFEKHPSCSKTWLQQHKGTSGQCHLPKITDTFGQFDLIETLKTRGMLFSQPSRVGLCSVTGRGGCCSSWPQTHPRSRTLKQGRSKCHQATLDACEKPNMSVPTFCNTSWSSKKHHEPYSSYLWRSLGYLQEFGLWWALWVQSTLEHCRICKQKLWSKEKGKSDASATQDEQFCFVTPIKLTEA